jgi:retron-type reverse transcriptase
MAQQAAAQVLVPIYYPLYPDHGYGFRPGRSAHDAVRKALGTTARDTPSWWISTWAKYFDSINHDKLTGMLKEHVNDEDMLRLIRRLLKCGF